MPNGPKRFQTSIGASISGLVSFIVNDVFGASFFSAQSAFYIGLQWVPS